MVNVSVEEYAFDGNKIDVLKLNAIAYDSLSHGFYTLGERVGEAFKDGLKLK